MVRRTNFGFFDKIFSQKTGFSLTKWKISVKIEMGPPTEIEAMRNMSIIILILKGWDISYIQKRKQISLIIVIIHLIQACIN